jgi:hypothetical protein
MILLAYGVFLSPYPNVLEVSVFSKEYTYLNILVLASDSDVDSNQTSSS